jgi:hypothetical protein
MKLFVVLTLALPLAAGKTPLTWTQAVVESSLQQAHYGEVYHEPAVCYKRSLTPVRESIYIDAGEWQYHVSQTVTKRRVANLREGDRVEVAVNGRSLMLRVGSKRYTTQIVHKFRGQPVSPPASPQ